MISRYYVPQMDESDCGVAALATVLRKYNSYCSLSSLRDLSKTGVNGTTALGLIKAAKHFNLETKAIKADLSLFKEKNLNYPIIVQVLKDNRFYHFYVVFEKKNNYIKIADPDPNVGIIKMNINTFVDEWTGIALLFHPNEKYIPIKHTGKSIWNYFKYILKYKKLVSEIISSSLCITLIGIIGSYYIEILVDKLIPNKNFQLINIFSLCLIFSYVIQQTMSFIQNYLVSILNRKLSIDIILKYINHIFNLPMSFFSSRKTGEIVSRFNDANKIIDALANTIISFFLDTFIILILSLFLIIQSYTLFLVTLLLIPAYSLIIYIFFKPFKKLNNQVMESNSKLSSSIIDDLKGIETVKSLNSENDCYKKIKDEFNNYLEKTLKYSRLIFMQESLKTSIKLIMNVAILWLGSELVIRNKLSIGQLMAFSALISYFISPIENIISLQTKIQSAQVSNNRLNEVMTVKSEFKEKRKIDNFKDLDGKVTFNNVFYSYGYDKKVLAGVDLSIYKNQKISIVGISGSGKSTIAHLLNGFYNAEYGNIEINGHNIKEINRKTLRSYINYVPQTPYLLNGTFLDNILLGCRDGLNYNDIKEACDISEINDLIESTPLGFETNISENGVVLSGGEKQRITIARALLSPAKIIIFDESTSSLDMITEDRIINKLLSLKNKTIIFIAHRINIAKKTENIVLLDNGKVSDQGTHEELLKRSKLYYNLCKK